jgi:hypothetical protein
MPGFLSPPPPDYPVVITQDYGGYVAEYENAAFNYREKGVRVEIRGQCRSACTLALTVPNVCVAEGAIVAWHQAYEPNTHRLRPDVTNRMLANMPPRIKQHLEGKIQASYTTEATLNYSDLRSLGIPDCNEKPYKAPTVAANVNYVNTPQNTINSTPESSLTPEEQKEASWAKYWQWAADTSKAQFGKLNMRKFNIKNGVASVNIYYWDKQGMYVSAIQYTKNDIAFERKVCRSEEVVPDEMTCKNWDTGKQTKFEYDLFSGRYEQAQQ